MTERAHVPDAASLLALLVAGDRLPVVAALVLGATSLQEIAEHSSVPLRDVQRVLTRVRDRGIDVTLTPAARTLLGDLGYDPTYGARPLKRVIQRHLVDQLARGLLEHRYAAGDRVLVDAAEGELTFERAGAAVSAF